MNELVRVAIFHNYIRELTNDILHSRVEVVCSATSCTIHDEFLSRIRLGAIAITEFTIRLYHFVLPTDTNYLE